jgi:hypothetical protein
MHIDMYAVLIRDEWKNDGKVVLKKTIMLCDIHFHFILFSQQGRQFAKFKLAICMA